MTLGERFLRGGIWAFLAQAIVLPFGLISNGLLARILSPDELGVYFVAISLASTGALIGQFGMSQSVVRLVVENLDRPSVAGQAVKMVLITGSIGSVVVAASFSAGLGNVLSRIVFESEILHSTIGLVGVLVIAITLRNLVSQSLRGFHDILMAELSGRVISSSLFVCSFAYLWAAGVDADLSTVLSIVVGGIVISVLVGVVGLAVKIGEWPNEDEPKIRKILSISKPLWVSTIFLSLSTIGPLWIIGALGNESNVAIFGSCSRLVTLVLLPLVIANQVTPPMIVELYTRRDLQQLEQLLRSSATLAGIPAFVVLLIFIVFSGDILAVIYGDYYKSGGSVLAVLSLGYLFNVACGPCGVVLMMTGNGRIMMWITAFTITIVLLSSYIAFQFFEVLGVASAVSGGMILHNILMVFSAKKMVGVWTCMSLRIRDRLAFLLKS
jgi:O-antigen/teichoic acid export membrane protein